MTWSVTDGTVMPAHPRLAEAQPPAPRPPGFRFEGAGSYALCSGDGHLAHPSEAASGPWCERLRCVRGASVSTLGVPARPRSSRRWAAAGRRIRTLASSDLSSPVYANRRARISSRELHRQPKVKPDIRPAGYVVKGSMNPGRDD
jgi:hypothetical protein